MSDEAFARRVHRVGALADPVRRALYRFVADQPDAVSRDQAADGIDVPRHTAKHHLDKLVAEGLLVTEFRRLTGRTGPGAGRPAKLYRRALREIGVSLPARRYDFAGDVLADAVRQALDGTPMPAALTGAARRAAAEAIAGFAAPDGTPLECVAAVLAPYGYEPRLDMGAGEHDEGEPQDGPQGHLTLANCPFELLAREHARVVCGVNQEFLREVVEAVGKGEWVAVPLDEAPSPDGCCVRVRRTSS